MNARHRQGLVGSVTGALLAYVIIAFFGTLWPDSIYANPLVLAGAAVAGAMAGGLALLSLASVAGRDLAPTVSPLVVAIPEPVAIPRATALPPPVAAVVVPAPAKRRLRQVPFFGRFLAARLSPEMKWEKLSRSLQKLLDTSGKKLRGASILDLIHQDDRTVIERRFQSPTRMAFDARFRLLPPAKKNRKVQPAPLNVQMTAAPWRDEQGKVCAWRCLFTDMSRQVQAEDLRQSQTVELAQAQEKWKRIQRQFDRLKESYYDLYHNAPVMYFSLDAEGKFVTLNETLLRILGYRREELLGQKYMDVLAKGDDASGLFEVPGDKQEERETQWRRHDGSLVDVWLRTAAVYDEHDNFMRWRNSALDFTERNRLANQLRTHTEELERTNARLRHINSELEDFTHVVSHDLKEPLRTLQAYSHLLAEDFSSQLSTDGFQYINHLLQASRRLGHLIDDLLNLSQAGRAARAPQPFGLIESVATVRRDLVHLIQRREATILTEGTLPTVIGDPQRITQLLTNLVANGLKYNKSPKPEVVIGQAQGDDDRQAVIFVRDNGIGIDPEHHQRIFGLFRRLNNQDEYEGTGAGLAICKKIVEAHGGRIWIESQPGQGSTFFFTLPKVTVAASKNGRLPRVESKAPSAVKPRSAASGAHVLLVEDSPDVGAIIQNLGKRAGINITWFTTAEQAWDWLQDARPDFLLLDINLPGMNGMELCRRVRSELNLEAPIALFSQNQQPADMSKLREIGADHFLSKDLLSQPAVWQNKLDELLTARQEAVAVGP
jgi:PAS domain S-box-containing protein